MTTRKKAAPRVSQQQLGDDVERFLSSGRQIERIERGRSAPENPFRRNTRFFPERR